MEIPINIKLAPKGHNHNHSSSGRAPLKVAMLLNVHKTQHLLPWQSPPLNPTFRTFSHMLFELAIPHIVLHEKINTIYRQTNHYYYYAKKV